MDKSEGLTLEAIGNSLGVTRERVRQIIVKTVRLFTMDAEMVSDALAQDENSSFPFDDLKMLFSNEELAKCCKHVLLESSHLEYFKFSDRFVLKNKCPENVHAKLHEFANDIIGEGLNLYDHLEAIEDYFNNKGLSFFVFEDIMNYLVQAGYHFYGDYVSKGKQSYAKVLCDAINKYFQFDIKLDSEEANEDILLLRKIADKHYRGLELPEGNRALTARLASVLILSGRGRYCPIEKTVYNIGLYDEVRDFIINSHQSTFYYIELFTLFQGRFLMETNITNHHFLHGMMKHLYPQDFEYERDLLVKNGGLRQDVNDRIANLISDRGQAVSKAEILESIPGISDFVISFTVARVPEIIQWDYNLFNHIDNI
ncbi:MAG: hypothetical protein GX853_07445 [Chloroflexi bacterium]|nr:hypothetical protein [Chloroflexota bacterium]